jgi:hypothetical protein
LELVEWGDLDRGKWNLHDMALTINNGLGGMAMFILSNLSVPLRACFEKGFTGLKLPLLPPSRNSRETY